MPENEILGIIVALTTAMAWATSTIILKMLVARIDIFTLNAIRLWVGAAVLLTIIVASGRWTDYLQTPLAPLLLVAASGVMAMAVGDTFYIKSLSLLDASKAFSIAQCSFPILATVVAVLFLGETFTWFTAIGAVLVVGGIYLIAARDKRLPDLSPAGATATRGVVFALTAAGAWTAATASLKIGTLEMDAIVAAGIRIPVAATLLTLLVISRKREDDFGLRKVGRRNLALMAAAGMLTYGVAAVGYVTAMQMIGAAKTVLVTTTAPIFVLPFSVLLLKERPGRLTIAGILTSVAGVCFFAI